VYFLLWINHRTFDEKEGAMPTTRTIFHLLSMLITLLLCGGCLSGGGDDDDGDDLVDDDADDSGTDDSYDDTVTDDDDDGQDDDSGEPFTCSWDEEGTEIPVDDDTLGDPCIECNNCHEGIPAAFQPPELSGVTLGGSTWTVSDNGEDICWVCALCYVRRLSEHSFCGYQDWRLPTIAELEGLVDTENPQQIICHDWVEDIDIRSPFKLTCGSAWSIETLPYMEGFAAKAYLYNVNNWAESEIWTSDYTNALAIRP
jgi:hypothetical protein